MADVGSELGVDEGGEVEGARGNEVVPVTRTRVNERRGLSGVRDTYQEDSL